MRYVILAVTLILVSTAYAEEDLSQIRIQQPDGSTGMVTDLGSGNWRVDYDTGESERITDLGNGHIRVEVEREAPEPDPDFDWELSPDFP